MKINGRPFEGGIADSWASRLRGLSGRQSGNMLFVFPVRFKPGFWMWRMKFPIWISFLDDGGVVVEAKKAEPLGFNPKTWRTYSPKERCRYVLETEFEVKAGDKVEW